MLHALISFHFILTEIKAIKEEIHHPFDILKDYSAKVLTNLLMGLQWRERWMERKREKEACCSIRVITGLESGQRTVSAKGWREWSLYLD